MNLAQIEIRYRDANGAAHVFAFDHPPRAGEISARDANLALDARVEPSGDAMIAHARLVNRGALPVRLDTVWFRISTGFDASSRARFFKHGYQSWSASRGIAIGSEGGPVIGRKSRIARINHQSEVDRPSDAPEKATSELFTIVESSGGERVLAGFLDGASSLLTLTVLAPDLISARVILDGIELGPGAARELAPLYCERSRESAGRMAARWASKIGAAMRARTGARFQRGWCSWYHYFHAITEDAMRANLRALARMRSEFPIEVVQLDDGFQAALGDWDITNEKFPGGLEKLADEIREAGFAAGIWTAPFLAARDSHLMSAHPEWFVRHETGQPLRAGYNPNWTRHEDKYAYALDPSHPEFCAHLEALFRKLVHQFGYSYLKLDFLYAAAAEGLRHDVNLTRAQTLRRGLDAIRAGAGDDAFILGCGCPMGPAIGVVDGMRIGPDVSPYWGGEGSGDPSTVHALDAIIARSFMHRRLWLNDPDCLMLRGKETQLTGNESSALASVIAGSGGMLLISDDMALLGAEESKLFHEAASLGAEIDSQAARAAVVALDLMDDSNVRGMIAEIQGGTCAIVLNRGDSAATFDASSIGGGPLLIRELGGKEEPAPPSIDLPAHSARIVRIAG